MPKVFNTTAICIPDKHYMVNIEKRLQEMKALVDAGKYFTINRAWQYGKTTTLRAFYRYLQTDYDVVLLDFQSFGSAEFQTEQRFSRAFAGAFVRSFRRNPGEPWGKAGVLLDALQKESKAEGISFALMSLFESLSGICEAADKPIVLMIDEVDSAANNQVFLDFLAQLRAQYMERDLQGAFQSVILAGVYDVKNLRRKLRPDEAHQYNSPWNIAADFRVELSFSREDIAGMLLDYEQDYHNGMDVEGIAELLEVYTSGYPFLVSRLCQLLDEEISSKQEYGSRKRAWTKEGFLEAVRMLLSEKNTLFESMSEKLDSYPELNQMLYSLLFTGKGIVYNYYEPSINMGTMFGLVKNQNGVLAVANRIFETWLYNLYLSSADMQKKDIYAASLLDKNQFIANGHLNMRLVLERFVTHFHELYGDSQESFLEEEGRKYFLLYLRPIINETGNYYIEARTREQKRTDLIVDYRGEQYIVEMKIWHGQEYHSRGEQQLAEYLDAYHVQTGYLLSFDFNKKKKIGVRDVVLGDKRIVEAVV